MISIFLPSISLLVYCTLPKFGKTKKIVLTLDTLSNMISCLVVVCVIAWIGSPNECVTITSLRLYQFGTSQPVDYLDVTGPYSLPHWLYFEFTLNLNESVRVIDFEKDNELLYKSDWNKALIKDELFLGFTRYQITLDVLRLSNGKLVFLQPSVAMEGTYRMTMKARDISGHETVSQWVLMIDALSRCTEMKFDEAFMDASTCIVGMHFYCERPIYPLRTVTRRRVEWTSPDDPDFELRENLRLDEFQTLTDGRILFDFLALYHIRPDSPTSVEMRFMFSQLDDIPLIDHHHTFSTNANQSWKCRYASTQDLITHTPTELSVIRLSSSNGGATPINKWSLLVPFIIQIFFSISICSVK